MATTRKRQLCEDGYSDQANTIGGHPASHRYDTSRTVFGARWVFDVASMQLTSLSAHTIASVICELVTGVPGLCTTLSDRAYGEECHM